MTDVEVLPSTARKHRSLPVALLESLRPRQWVKNVLVVAAPLAAGRLLEPDVLTSTLLALLVFVSASAGTYLINDARDMEHDRRHPVKMYRPIARGDVPVRVAVPVAVVLLLASVVVPLVLDRTTLGACTATYVVLMQAYSIRLKNEPVLDLAIVSAGFLLRALAGGLAAGLPLSRWFLIVTAFGSLFMVAGKRYSESRMMGEFGAETRESLRLYSQTYLRFVWTLAASILVTGYCLWAFEVEAQGQQLVAWSALSVAPFVLAVLRYARDVDLGRAGEPEDVVLGDRGLLLLGLLWLLTFTLGVFDV